MPGVCVVSDYLHTFRVVQDILWSNNHVQSVLQWEEWGPKWRGKGGGWGGQGGEWRNESGDEGEEDRREGRRVDDNASATKQCNLTPTHCYLNYTLELLINNSTNAIMTHTFPAPT